jgi:hypothetical protein
MSESEPVARGGAVAALLAQAQELLAEIEDKLISQPPAGARDFNQVFERGGAIDTGAQWIVRGLAEQQHRIAQIVREVQAESGPGPREPGSVVRCFR